MVWEINYSLSSGLIEKGRNGDEDIDGIRFLFDSSGGSLKLTGFKIVVEASSEDDAISKAQIKANRILDYLTGIHRIPISASLANFKTPEGIMTVKSVVKIKWHGINAEDLDLSLVDNMIRCNDVKLMRQLSHYRMGLRASDDVITQIREFYMIIDDEGEKYARFLSDYKGIRDFVSHPKIDNPYALMPNGTSFEKNYLDLSIPEATKELEKYAGSLKAKAEEIIISKLMP